MKPSYTSQVCLNYHYVEKENGVEMHFDVDSMIIDSNVRFQC